MSSRIVPLVLLALLVAAPFVLRPAEEPPPPGARTLVVVSPHNEQIRTEFAWAFDHWHRERYGERVHVAWSVPGGTSEIRRMLQAEFTAAIESGRTPGGSADILFGGGSYEHGVIARGVTARGPDGEERTVSISVPVELDAALLQAAYGDGMIADVPLFDPEGHWYGTALSGFGIVYNRDVLGRLGVDEPTSWTDLGDPRFDGWVALVNPGQSGSITTAFQAIIERRGWETGWRILRRAAANARYFSASSLRPPADVARKKTAVGFPIFHIDMKVVADDGRECGPGEEGELLIKGPHVTPGYWNKPEATAETIVDGWLHTGDMARRDDEGYFTIIGRSKDMFISGGENVYPAEVESVMLAFPGVSEAALVGVPHEVWGEVGKAFVVPAPGADLDVDGLLEFMASRLAKYKLPREVVPIEEMPKTVIGKIDKKVLAQGGAA